MPIPKKISVGLAALLASAGVITDYVNDVHVPYGLDEIVFDNQEEFDLKNLEGVDAVIGSDILEEGEVRELAATLKHENGAQLARTKAYLAPFVQEAVDTNHINEIGLDELVLIMEFGANLQIENVQNLNEDIWKELLKYYQ